MSVTNMTVVSVVYGNYFERFGNEWVSTLEQAGCDNAVLVSDKHVPVPSFVKLVVREFESMALFFKTGHQFLEADWVVNLGFDDLLLPGGLDPIMSDADVYGWPAQYTGLMSGYAKYQGGFEKMPYLSNNPMLGGWAYRSDLLREIPFRDYLYFDEVHFCELSYFGKTIEVSSTPRSTWFRHDDAFSVRSSREATHDVARFREKLRAGEIEKGIPE